MANQSISQLPVATALTGDELTVVVQNGVTKQTQVSDIANVVIPGKLIDYLYFDGNSDLIVVYSDATTQNLGPIPGYIAAEIAPNGHLILTNSDGGTTDAGSVFASLAQTFLTVGNETSSLANSSRLVAGANITLTPGANTLTISTSGASGSLNGAGTGIIVKDSSTSVVSRTLTSTAGISITNPDGIAGNPVIAPELKLADIQNLATTGILAVVGGTTVVDRNIVGTASQITVVDGDGSGNPTISIADNPVFPGTGSMTVPTGTTAERPGALAGQIRFNSTLNVFEGQDNAGVWKTLALGGGVTSVGTGTGLTGGPITSTGTISIANTGVTAASYGDGTNVPQIVVNAQGQITSATNVAITASGIGAITAVNGTANEISTNQVGTAVTVGLPTALTFTGKTVTDGTFNMTAATVGSDTVTTNTATQTLTNKTISGASNTLTNIGNSSLVNSSLTVGTTNIALGATSLTLDGLTSVTVTQDPTADLQLATKQYVDSVAQGLNAKAACVYGTTGNILLTGLGTQAGGDWASSLTAGDRILVKNQTLPQDNGIYVASALAWTRSTDMNTWSEVPSSFVFIEDGTTLADTGWVTTANATGTIGVTPMPWVQFSGAGTYTAGTGLTLTGTQFSITNTAVTAGSYGSASAVPTYTVNAQGQLTAASNTTISIAPTQINSTTGSGAAVLATNPTISSPNIDVIDFDTAYATTLTAGQMGWDGNNTLGLGMFGGNVIQRIGEDVYIYVKASSAITKGQLTMFTGAVGASSVVTAAPSTGVTNGQYIIGLAAEDIALNGFGLIQILGNLRGFDTSAFADGDVLYYDSAVTGGLTKTYPTSGPIVTVCAVTNAGSGGSGSVQVRVSVTQRITASTGISVSQTSSGTVITNTSPSTGGTVTSVSGTGTVSGITLSGTVTTSGSLTLGGTLDLSSPPAIGGTTPNLITGTTITATNYVGISGGTF